MPIIIKSAGLKTDPSLPLSAKPSLAMPSTEEPDCIVEDVEDCGEDDLSDMLTNSPESPMVLDFILKELANEGHRLKQKRNDKNVSTTQLVSKRVDILKKIGDIWLKRTELTKKTTFDIKSPEFNIALTLMLDKVKSTMEESGFNKEMQQVFFTRMSEEMNSYEEDLNRKFTALRETEAKKSE
jgi:hypothetical protein